jgi:hypothetical protein
MAERILVLKEQNVIALQGLLKGYTKHIDKVYTIHQLVYLLLFISVEMVTSFFATGFFSLPPFL